MNKIKYITLFIVLALLGAMSSYADIKFNNSYDRFLQAFESSEAKFKFYSMKANVPIEYDIDSDEIKSICIELMSNLGMEESDIKIEDKWNQDEKQIYLQAKDEDTSISIVGIKKSSSESYIMVDILDNKVYKNIVDIYNIIENTLKKHTSQLEMYTCIAGEYTKKLQINKYNDILEKILYNMSADEIDRVQEDNFVSVTAYSKLLNENYLEYLGNKINLNIGLRYSEDEEKTLIYMATPIIKLDY